MEQDADGYAPMLPFRPSRWTRRERWFGNSEAWKNPDLGPSTTIQLLDEAVNRDRLFFGEFNAQVPSSLSVPTSL